MALFHRNVGRDAGPFFGKCLFVAAAILGIAGCGLPQYNVLTAPTAFTIANVNQLGFRTPDIDTSIQGYIVFYKVYRSDEESVATSESTQFDPNFYSDDDTKELEPGDRLPNDLDFVRAGEVGQNTFGTWLVDHPGAGIDVVINFDPKGIGFYRRDNDPPTIDNTLTTISMARGTIDQNASGTQKNVPEGTFRSFVGEDWEVDLEQSATGDFDGFYDGDLQRPPPLNPINPTTLSGTPIMGVASASGFTNTLPANLLISVCVYATGIDPNDLTRLESVPVHLGIVVYPVLETVSADRIRS